MKSKYAFLFLFFLGTQTVFSQTFQQFSFAATSEAIGLPFTNYLPYHPGVEISGTLRKKDKANNVQYLNVKAGFFYHRRLETAIYLGGEYQFSQKLFRQKISVDFPVGLGYLHSFYPGELYEQNGEGGFEKVNQLGRPHLYVNLGVGLTYLGIGRFQPFIRQELMVETPFANGIPAIPHSLVKIGVQIKLNNNDNQ
ncbi:MAG: hypothetical protein AAFV95_10195 [Bacteroidota bacterium]